MSHYNKISALRRLGNKNKIADKIISYFPKGFRCLISMFYGTGSLENRFLGKIPYIFANDLDDNVYNFYKVLTNHFDELYEAIELFPYHQTAWNELKASKPDCPIQKAMRFIVLSNWSFLGKGATLRFGLGHPKRVVIKLLKAQYLHIINNPITTTQFFNCDFREVLGKITKKEGMKEKSFIFADPPYLATATNYETPKWTQKDVDDLFRVLVESDIRFAMSEFDHPYVVELAEKHSLNVIEIGERKSLKNRSVEILITNYKTNTEEQLTLFKKQ